MSAHELAKLPEILTDTRSPGLFEHDRTKLEIVYRCTCGTVIRTSDTVPSNLPQANPDEWAATLRQLTARSRDRWEDHVRG